MASRLAVGDGRDRSPDLASGQEVAGEVSHHMVYRSAIWGIRTVAAAPGSVQGPEGKLAVPVAHRRKGALDRCSARRARRSST
jgi:hypothetical protein